MGRSYSNHVHDNFVYEYRVQLERQRITLFTEYRDQGEIAERKINLVFSGVVAHQLECVLYEPANILLDVEETEPGLIYERDCDRFQRLKNHRWPFTYKSPEELVLRLSQLGVKGYWVMGSCGMDGWILATTLEVVTA